MPRLPSLRRRSRPSEAKIFLSSGGSSKSHGKKTSIFIAPLFALQILVLDDFWVFSLFLMGGGGRGGRGGEREKTNMLEIAPEDPRRAIPLPDLKNFSSLLLFVFTLIGRSPPTEVETSEEKKADSTMKCIK